MVTSGVVIAIPGIAPEGSDNMEFTETGTPADNFPDTQRAQFCGQGDAAKSNSFVTEYLIPTECTQPLAITSDFAGNIWFMQSNTGNVAKFDPVFEQFTEYDNPTWPPQGRSMVWGMDYSPDNSIWYSDEAFDSVWRFSIDDEKYQRMDFPSEGNSLPQRLVVDGSKILINDFTGNKLTILDASAHSQDTTYINIPSPVEQSVTAGFAIDDKSNLWYTNWIPNADGVLVKLDPDGYAQDLSNSEESEILNHLEIFKLPPSAIAINGVSADRQGKIWLVDTASSNFYGFDPSEESFTQYVTSPVQESAYGNYTGLIKSTPLSRPYWTGLDNSGQIVFNEQTANRMGFFDPINEKLTEYTIPSQNPLWADCGNTSECGIAQVFDFTIVGDKVWFTEWATNKIGFVDTSISPLYDVSVESDPVYLNENSSFLLEISAFSDVNLGIVTNSPSQELISLEPETSTITLSAGEKIQIPVTVSYSDELAPGKYKVLAGATTSEISVSQFATLIVG